MKSLIARISKRVDEILRDGDVNAHTILIWLALIVAILALAGTAL